MTIRTALNETHRYATRKILAQEGGLEMGDFDVKALVIYQDLSLWG